MEAVKTLIKNYKEIIIEEYIPGYECKVWIIGNPGNYQMIAPLLESHNERFILKKDIYDGRQSQTCSNLYQT